ncbi:MAG: hypothetical protein FWD23_15065 [Oscillospiraceae bacterium]|nr:hypothetical protein [Oscillospiraceae bacterium]
MKTRIISFVFLLSLLCLSGCDINISGKGTPEPEGTFAGNVLKTGKTAQDNVESSRTILERAGEDDLVLVLTDYLLSEYIALEPTAIYMIDTHLAGNDEKVLLVPLKDGVDISIDIVEYDGEGYFVQENIAALRVDTGETVMLFAPLINEPNVMVTVEYQFMTGAWLNSSDRSADMGGSEWLTGKYSHKAYDNEDYNEENGGVVIRRDKESLVEVRIENGAASLVFDLDKWEGVYQSGPFNITGLSGRVKDACVGKVAELDPYAEEYIMPAVLLLMEDGSLEWLQANPFVPEWLYSFGKLPWLKDIVSLSYEPHGENTEELTIIAADKSGLRYDVRTFCWLVNIFEDEWIYENGPVTGLYDDIDAVYLGLGENGDVSLRRGLLYNGDAYAFYAGKYTVSFTGSNPAGIRSCVLELKLWNELDLDMSNPDFSSPPELTGKYFFEADGVYLTLHLTEGDPLSYSIDDGSPTEQYPFYPSFIYDGFYGDEDYSYIYDSVFYIIENLCEETINYLNMGITALLTDYTVTLDGEVCYIVYMGTDYSDDGFLIPENAYAVELNSMQVYRFDESNDIWIPLSMG